MGGAASSRKSVKSASAVESAAQGAPQQKPLDKSAQSTAEKYSWERINVYFASQTGTADGFARILVKEGTAAGLDVHKCDLEKFDKDELGRCHLAIFLMANTGEGEPPDNAKKFFKWLTKKASPGCLPGVLFTVFGLGNSTYENFNKIGRVTNEKLEEIGCERLFDYGEGDDSKDLEDDFKRWRDRMWTKVIAHLTAAGAAAAAAVAPGAKITNGGKSISMKVAQGLATPAELAEETKVIPHFYVKEASEGIVVPTIDVGQVNNATKHFFNASTAKVIVNRELRNNSASAGGEGGSTRHIELDIKGTGIKYTAADNLSVLPENDPKVVEAIAKRFGYSLDKTYYVEPIGDTRHSFPSPFTLREAFTRYFDLQGRPKTGTLTELLPYTTDDAQKDWLRRIVASNNRDGYKQLIVDEYRTIVDLLMNELSSCQIPLDDFMHIVPFMQPRQYTISSSALVHPETIHLTAGITMKKTPSGRKFKGLCSRYIESLEAGVSSCQVFATSSTFRLPKELSTPIIMFGPGTGVAPMRALLQERQYQGDHQAKQDCDCAPFGNNTLYFGCKNRDIDYIYRNEFEDYVKDEVITKLLLAFSRDQKEKIYVQTLLRQPENAAKFVDEVNGGAYIYVCGTMGMGSDLHEAILNVIMEGAKLNRDDTIEFVKGLQQKGRYVQELWSDS